MRNRSIRKQLLLCIRTTIGGGGKQLVVPYANHYSFALGTTTGLSANDYYFHSRLQLRHATSSEKNGLYMDASALRNDTSPPAAEAAGGDDCFQSLFVLQALLLQVDPLNKAIHDILIDISMLLIQVIEVQALLIQDIRIKLIRRVIERGLPLLLQLRHPVGDHRLQVLAIADELTHLVLSEIA